MCGDGTIPSPFNRTSIPSHRRAFKNLPQVFVSKMPKKHISQQRASSDIPEYLLPPHPSERNSLRPPPPLAHRVQPPPPSSSCWRYSRWPCQSRPCVPSGILSCPRPAAPRSVQLLTIYLHSRSNTALHHTSAERSKTLWGDSHTRDSGPRVGGVKKTITQHSCNACQLVCTAAMSSYGSPHMPPPPQSWRQQLMLRIVHKV